MKKTITLCLALLLGTSIYALAEGGIECKEDGTQMEMNKCAYDDFLRADRELNHIYQALRRAKRENILYLRNLRKAQKAWLVYRDADLDAQFSCEGGDLRSCFGSMYGLSLNSAKAELTNQRIKILREQLEEANL
ncbi:MAG: Unknown protein [uncultured Sulfurovum sp.]|uniref:Lysozyme inhibitor LprI-like N-terminal domain-containing protein n=1 Tax=uncultured Sulfurovum sp. TaxID=269237 RepID=A0A6S6T673_9BACT|nr:MAG: Unknown protein [uncultured Sulfurovum sp.]